MPNAVKHTVVMTMMTIVPINHVDDQDDGGGRAEAGEPAPQ